MKVVIVAKTRRGSGACVGGITFDGQSVRLEAVDAAQNPAAGMAYEVGDVWDLEARPQPNLVPPHVENVIVHDKRRQPPLDDVVSFIEKQMPPRAGGPEVLYEGLLQRTKAGALYIAARCGVPPYSTTFWRPDKPLVLETGEKRIRYRYPGANDGCTVTFVGFQEPVARIAAGTLLRISLAPWWCPERLPDGELRCYTQLSGWFDGPPARIWPASDLSHAVTPATPPAEVPIAQSPPEATIADAERLMKTVFGFDDFMPLQREVIASVLAGRDAVAIMPTGGGKSLCYQLPALLFAGVTVVVSPLISLMQDQVDQLRQMDVAAAFLNSTLSYEAQGQTGRDVRAGRIKLLYAAPETLLRPETMMLLQQSNVACLAIDEAHCISAWGHDFRPEYRQLVQLRQRLPHAVCLAVTATATERVRRDIRETLQIAGANEFVASFDRPNLLLQATPRMGDGLAQLLDFLQTYRGEAGIIYCPTRAETETIAAALAARGWSALPYHAGLDDTTRRDHQRRFARDDVAVIVATIAFGMGIDKSNVRFIVHYGLPKNLETYYQAVGRAGRDGLKASCLLLYSRSDLGKPLHFIEMKQEPEKTRAKQRLWAMLDYAESPICRRHTLLAYFGEKVERDNCEMCDNCRRDEAELEDLTVLAQKFLSCVKRTGEIFGANHIVKVLRGSRAQAIRKHGHDRLSTHGIGADLSRKQWLHLAAQFEGQGLLERDMRYGGLSLTALGAAVLYGKQQVRGILLDDQSEKPRDRGTGEIGSYEEALFEQLRAKRKQLADIADVPPYVIFPDRSLLEMAARLPHSPDAFGQIYGVGKAKQEKYATVFLAVIRAYCEEHDLSPRETVVAAGEKLPAPTAARLSPRTREVAEAFNTGASIAELATTFAVQERTIVNHLYRYVQHGHTLRRDGLLARCTLTPDQQSAVMAAFASHGTGLLRPVYDALHGKIAYKDLRLLRLVYLIDEADSA